MRIRTRFVGLSVVCLLASAAAAGAAPIVIDGGGPDRQDIYYADSDYSWTAATNNTTPFDVLDPITITGANWWGGCVDNAAGRSAAVGGGTPGACPDVDFTITFYDGTTGIAPGPAVATLVLTDVVQSLTGATISGGIAEYQYSATFAPITLGPGSYLFGLSATVVGTTWGWETTPFGEGQHFQFNQSDLSEGPVATWHTPPQALGFNLVGPEEVPTTPVPEPATVSLLAVGLAGGAIRKYRARRAR